MNKCIIYADFERVLIGLGFHRAQTTEPRIVLENAEHGAVLALPLYQPDETVRPHHWISARHTVDVMGILDRDDFDKALDQYDMAKSASA